MYMDKRGFTLIELLVVIAIIAVLIAVLIPALEVAKEQATAIVCLANQKGLCRAWHLYHEENDDWLVGGSTYSSTDYRWCREPLKTADPSSASVSGNDITMEHRLNGIRAGTLFPYTETEKAYHCPNDRNYVTQPQQQYKVYRTYAISGQMNSEDGRGGTVNWYPAGTKSFKMAKKFSDISSPGSKYVFVEEDVVNSPLHNPQDHNLGGFVLMKDGDYWTWWDIPAYFHNDRGTLGFADGHAEKHTWRDPLTVALMKHERGAPNQPLDRQPDNEDIVYMNQGYFPCR